MLQRYAYVPKLIFIQSVIAGEVNLKSEADMDAAMKLALRRFADENRAKTKKRAALLFALNIGLLLGMLYLF